MHVGITYFFIVFVIFFFFSSRRRHTRSDRDWSSDVCSSDLDPLDRPVELLLQLRRELLARRLVLGVCLMPERLAHVVHPGEVVGTPALEQPQQKVGDPQAADVFSPRRVVSGRAIIAKKAR